MNLYSALVLLYDSLLVLTCLYAWRCGGPTERVAAWAMLVASALSVVLWALPSFRWRTPRGEFLLLETGLLVVLLTLALRSDRFWPLWATAFQLIAATTQLLGLIEPARLNRAYVFLQGFWAYPILAAIATGTRRWQRRTVRARLTSSDSSTASSKP